MDLTEQVRKWQRPTPASRGNGGSILCFKVTAASLPCMSITLSVTSGPVGVGYTKNVKGNVGLATGPDGFQICSNRLVTPERTFRRQSLSTHRGVLMYFFNLRCVCPDLDAHMSWTIKAKGCLGDVRRHMRLLLHFQGITRLRLGFPIKCLCK
jgi:hypothetical protein